MKKFETFTEFTSEYGTHSTTNFQLIKYAEELNIPNFYCLMRDELHNINSTHYNTIINLHKSNEKGVHWSCFNNYYFFDSFGLPPTNEVKDLMINGESYKIRGYAEYSTFQIQDFDESYCGQMCLYVLYKLNNGEDFHSIVLELKLNYKK